MAHAGPEAASDDVDSLPSTTTAKVTKKVKELTISEEPHVHHDADAARWVRLLALSLACVCARAGLTDTSAGPSFLCRPGCGSNGEVPVDGVDAALASGAHPHTTDTTTHP